MITLLNLTLSLPCIHFSINSSQLISADGIRKSFIEAASGFVMHGFEVAGLVLGALPLVMSAMQMYSIAIGRSEEYQSGIFSHELRRERATLETIVQLLSQSDVTDPRAYRESAEPLLQKIADALDKTTILFTSVDEKSSNVTTIKRLRRGGGRLELQIEQISAYNKELLRLVNQITQGAAPKQISSTELSPSTSHSCRSFFGLPGPAGSKAKRQSLHERGQLLQQLVSSCDTLFFLATDSQPIFTDAFNKFRLWELDVKCEGLYRAMDHRAPSPSGSHRHDIVTILFRSVIRIIKVCASAMQGNSLVDSPKWQYAIYQCTERVRAACGQIPSLINVDAEDLKLADHTPEERPSMAVTTIDLVVQTLQSCLPAISRIACQYSRQLEDVRQYSMQIEDVQASDVTRLLDISMDLIGPVRTALPRVSELDKPRLPRRNPMFSRSNTTNVGKGYQRQDLTLVEKLSTMKKLILKGAEKVSESNPQKHERKYTAPVDLETICRVFDQQASALENWKAKNTQNIESELVNDNPAKLASIADSVENIVTLLSKVNEMMKEPDPSKRSEKELHSNIEALETFIQSLFAVGSQLNRIYAVPPPDRSDSEDRVLISLTGQRVLASA